MEKSNPLKPPKREDAEDGEDNQGQVPDILNAHASMDDLEGTLGIEDFENLPGYGQLSLQHNWEDEYSTSQLFKDAELWDGNSYGIGVKPESGYGGCWDFDEKKASLNLSLNYQEVLEAWSDRRPLWAPSNNYMGEVPVMEESTELWSRRQASVMRYKEKRQSRLFSKKIRYEVRKLNADNRPRIKGRFVKRFGDKMQKGSC